MILARQETLPASGCAELDPAIHRIRWNVQCATSKDQNAREIAIKWNRPLADTDTENLPSERDEMAAANEVGAGVARLLAHF
jgi:hypothetical protein